MTKATSPAAGAPRGKAASAKPRTRVTAAKKRPAAKATRTPATSDPLVRKKSTASAAAKSSVKSTVSNRTGSAARESPASGPGLIATLAGVSTAALAKATGHGWEYWLKSLDRLGAAKLPHQEIARMLYDKLGLRKNMWVQMIAIGYEQARGLRKPGQTPLGLAATVTRTIAVPVSALYAAWEEGRRGDWLPDAIEVRRATKNKSMKITWSDGSGVDVNFYAKGGEKAVIAIEQSRLPDESAVEAVKQLWSTTLDRLKSTLEGR
jgi:hypothetical protein